MLQRHSVLSVFLLVFVTQNHLAAGVQIDSVGLESGKPYVHRQSPAHIKFNLTLDPEETLQSVVWQKDDEKVRYEWEANGNVTVSGILQETINTSAANGELLFPSALNDHAGGYSLTVFTSSGRDTAAYKLIVYYYSNSLVSLSEKNCTWSLGVSVYEVAPYPNISCVFEDGVGGGPPSVPLDSIADVKRFVTYYENGTFRYEMTADVQVQNVPMESSMSWQFGIEDSIIPLYTIKSSSNAQPCPEPDTKPDLTYDIIRGMKTCYRGHGLYSRVSYFCTYGPSLQPRKTLECRSGGRWMETDKTAWPNCSTYAQPTTTTCEDCNSGTLLTFHLKLLAATFLIASYYTVK